MAVAFRAGKGATFRFDSTAGSLVNLSSGIDDITLSRSLDTPEVTTFGDNDRNYIQGLRGGTISFSGSFASTHAEVLDGVWNDATSTTYSWQLSPDGSTASGRHKLTGEGLLTSLEYGAQVDDKVTLSGEILITGAVTSTNW